MLNKSVNKRIPQPDIRFADLSHWYTGLEMVYGDFEQKLNDLQPVFDRVTHLHGRIGTPGCIQTPLKGFEDQPYVDHFRMMWSRICAAFKRQAKPDQILVFAPELLWPGSTTPRLTPKEMKWETAGKMP